MIEANIDMGLMDKRVDEIAPGHTTALYWEYDARLGRRWNLDPKLQ